MSPPRRMHLNAVIFGLGSHEAGWRIPESDPLASTSLDYWVDPQSFIDDVMPLLERSVSPPFVSDTAFQLFRSRIELVARGGAYSRPGARL
ncbi:hypothetical protein [Mesorhizobium sp. M1322]|uniref:hypothetical protein n=1 Tax=Mesorhizobium sp. M1322 TaxID=2957081 RepID=UPI0033397B87